MPDLYRRHARVIPKSLTYKSSLIDDKKNEEKKLYYKRRIHRTHKDIPEHVKNHIESLYNAMQNHLGQEERIRKRQIIAMLKIYYKWENNVTLQMYFDVLLKNEEKRFLLELQSKKLENVYHQKVLKLFGCMDVNGDAGIDLLEFKSAIDFLNVDSDQLFHQADKDQNGTLDAIEFYDIIAKTPMLSKNFDSIIENAEFENERQNMIKKSRLFSYEQMTQRPCLATLKKKQFILNSDIPLYNVHVRENICDAHKRYYGHKN